MSFYELTLISQLSATTCREVGGEFKVIFNSNPIIEARFQHILPSRAKVLLIAESLLL